MRFAIFVLFTAPLFGQTGPARWYEIRGQATTITDTHGPFPSPYEGLNSLRPIRETDSSVTITLFTGFKYHNTRLGFDGEIAGGDGFSGVAGIA